MRRLLMGTLVVAVFLYGFFEARRLLEGPQISIVTPEGGVATSSTAVLVAGTAANISFLTINDKPSHTDESGNFSELLVPPPGITVVTVSGVDRFGRTVSQSVSVTMLNYCSTIG